MNHVVLRGTSAEVRWAYHQAAVLGPWTLEAGALSAEIVSADSTRLSQQPLTFLVRRSNGAIWKWPIVTLTVEGAMLLATLGEV